MSSSDFPPAWPPPESHHTPRFCEDVNSRSSNHLLLGVSTPPCSMTRDSEMESLEDKELTYFGVTG